MKKKLLLAMACLLGIGGLLSATNESAKPIEVEAKEAEAPYIYGFEEENYPNGCTLTLETSDGTSGEWMKADSPYGDYASTGTTGDTLQLYHPHYSGNYGADATPADTDGWYKVGNIEPVHIMSLYYDYNYNNQGDSEAMFDGLVYINRYNFSNYFYIGNIKNTNHYAIAKIRGIWRIQVIGQYKFPETASRYPGQTLWIESLYEQGLELLTSENATPEASEHINWSFYHNNLPSNIAEIKAHHHNGGVQFHAKLGENVRSLAVGAQNTFGTAQYYYPIGDVGDYFGFFPQQEVVCDPTTSNAEYVSAVLAPRNATTEQYAQSAAFVFVNDTPTDYVSIGKKTDVKCYENNHVDADYYEKGTLNGDADSVIANYLHYTDHAYEGDEKITYASWVNRNPGDTIDFTVKLGAAWKFLPGLPSYHEHNWNYEANGNAITASCGNDDCDITDGLTLTLSAPRDLIYDGSEKEATLNAGYSQEAFGTPSIKYYQGENEVTECKRVGSYTAKVTVGGATASVDFEIVNFSLKDPTTGVGVEIIETPVADDLLLQVEAKPASKIAEEKATYDEILGRYANADELISYIYDVKLFRITDAGGEERKEEIQPSDIAPSATVCVSMPIPEEVNGKGFRILHIHNADKAEFVLFDSKDNAVRITVSKLNEFAFVTTKGASKSGAAANAGSNAGGIVGGIIGGILLASIIAYILLFFVFNKWIIYSDSAIRAFPIGKKDDEVRLLTWWLFRVEYREDEEVYKTKKDAEDAMKGEEKEKEPELATFLNGLPDGAIMGIMIAGAVLTLGIGYLLLCFVFNKWIIKDDKVVRAFGPVFKKDGKKRMITNLFRVQYRDEEEIFSKKEEAEDHLGNKPGEDK